MIRRSWFSAAMGDEQALLRTASAQLREHEVSTDQALRELLEKTNVESSNLATAMFYQYLLGHQRHGLLVKQVQEKSINTEVSPSIPHIIVVPGMFAIEKPELGGDGALLKSIALSKGFSVSTAPTDGQASISENAAILHEYLQSRPTEEYWLVSISRGSADVRFMLNKYTDANYHHRIRQWISMCGIVTGTPLVRGLKRNPVRSAFIRGISKLRGISTQLAPELDDEHPHWSYVLDEPAFGITHVLPIPLDWHVTSPVIPRYSRLKGLGPTDGIVLLADTLDQPGCIYPIWGADHMLRVPTLTDHLYRLIDFLKDE